jgi:hypothetical protein
LENSCEVVEDRTMANPTGKGGFKKGNPGGPGRPRRTTEQGYLDATVAVVSVEDWQKVVTKALAQAKTGDAKAREWLSKMLVGSDPIPLAQLVEELQTELEKLKHGKYLGGNGTPAVSGSPLANGPGGPIADRVGRRPGVDPEPGGDVAGPLADGAAPLF